MWYDPSLDKPKCVSNDVGIETNSHLSSCLVSISHLSLFFVLGWLDFYMLLSIFVHIEGGPHKLLNFSIRLIHSSSMQPLGLWSWTTMIKPHNKLFTKDHPIVKMYTPLFIAVTVIYKLQSMRIESSQWWKTWEYTCVSKFPHWTNRDGARALS